MMSAQDKEAAQESCWLIPTAVRGACIGAQQAGSLSNTCHEMGDDVTLRLIASDGLKAS